MLNRRSFLHQSSLLSLSPLVPAFLSQTALATEAGKDDRLLVVIQLDGGNDGLNTVIPFADDNYGKFRDKLRVDKKEIIKLNDSLGLHPGMKAAGELFDNRQLAIVPGVGYPNPSRSHFRMLPKVRATAVVEPVHDALCAILVFHACLPVLTGICCFGPG